jgi:hypothetical protein
MRRLLYWLAVVLAVAAVAGGGAVAYRAYSQRASATGVVGEYFAALRRGDAAAALGLGDVPGGPIELITPQVLRAQQAFAPIRHVHVASGSLHGDSGTVSVDYVIAFAGKAQHLHDDVPVVRRDGRWRLSQSAVPTSLIMTAASERADILGKAVPQGDVLMFPGAVPLHFDSPYLQVEPGEDYVSFATGSSLSLLVDVSPQGRSAVTALLNRSLRACLTQAHPDPLCPVPNDRYVPGSIHATPPANIAGDIDIRVQQGGAGLLAVTGFVTVHGTYRRLTFANVAVAGSGAITLQLAARGYAVEPLRLAWGAK